MSEKIELTKSGKEKLEREYRDLIDNQRPECKAQLKEAREQGDLSENADYDAARDLQARIEARITQIEHDLNNCIIIDEKKNGKKVGLGSKVTVLNLSNNKEYTYVITGTTESNPMLGQISKDCPLGQAIMGKESGTTVTVNAKVEYQVKILATAAADIE